MPKTKGGLLGPDYWTVHFPERLSSKDRKPMLETLKAEGLYKQTIARNTKAQAEKLAAEIKARFGFDMEVCETCDLYL